MKNMQEILLKSKKTLFSSIFGSHISFFKGDGYDFSEIKKYSQGDDTRRIDWITTARMQEPYVKVLHEERSKNIVIVTLLGGTLFFGTLRLKHELLAEVSALLGYSVIKRGDIFSAFNISSKDIKSYEPSKLLYGVENLVKDILEKKVLGEKNNFDISSLYKRIVRRSLVIFVGDFLYDIDLSFFGYHHDTVAVVITDRYETKPETFKEAVLTDNESLKEKSCFVTNSSLKIYKKRFKSHYENLYQKFHKTDIDYLEIFTDDEPFEKLNLFFRKRV